MDDLELLRQYGQTRCQRSFAELVSRYVNLVYSAALRQVHDHHRAEEITQAVFIVLAKKANALGANVMLGGWLLQTTGYAVKNLLRRESRRKRHERKAAEMNPTIENDDAKARAWEQIEALLDEGIRRLPAKARDAVILRYLEERSPDEVARRLGISEQAARQRVSRAVELLREHFVRRGVAVPAALVATLLGEQSVHAAPTGLAASTAALAATATPLSNGILTMIFMSKIKAAAGIVFGMFVFAAVTAAVLQAAAPRNTPATPPAGAEAVGNADPSDIEITGTVLKPNGQPLADAEVFLADSEHPVYVYGEDLPDQMMVSTDGGIPLATYFDRRTANKVKTLSGADGRFSFAVAAPPSKLSRKVPDGLLPGKIGTKRTTPTDPGFKADPIYQIVVRAEEGFAQVFVDDLPASHEILLTAWGRIEGNLTMGGKPGAGEQIFLSRWPRLDDKTLFHVCHDQVVRADGEGHFVIPRVAPGDIWLTRRLRPKIAAATHVAYVDVKAGETANVMLGGERSVIANLVQPKNSPETILWQDRWNWTEGEVQSLPEPAPFKYPADWYSITAAQQHARMEEWGRTAEGQVYKKAFFKRTFFVNPDGTFTIPDLSPGKYQVKIAATQGPGMSETLATLEHTFEVGKANAGESLHLGTLEVKLADILHVGDAAPAFKCQTVDGASLKLDSSKGKYVLLYFCESGMEKTVKYLDNLQAIRSAYAKDDRLAIITLYTDAEPDRAKQLVDARKLSWAQAYIGRDSKIQADYHAPATMIFLIGPDGKVLGRHLWSDTLDGAVRAALGKRG